MNNPIINVQICAGKGGVGKTTIAVSCALQGKSGEKILLIDHDGGHSVKRTLDINYYVEPNKIVHTENNLYICIIENIKYNTITKSHDLEDSTEEYLFQFEDDMGIVPFADMVHEFFGVPTDVDSLQKFIVLVQVILEAKKAGFSKIIIDVEPTAGLERLLSSTDSMVRSLRNLKDKSPIILMAVKISWPDIAKYLKSDYIKAIDFYTERIIEATEYIKNAKFVLVTTPETSPVAQSFEVNDLIEKFGGKVSGYVINNMRGEDHEIKNIQTIEKVGLPVAKIERKEVLHSENKIDALKSIGATVQNLLSL